MKKREIVILAFLAGILSSCIGTQDIKYLQPNENLQINSEGLVPYNVPTYRVTKNDILSLNIITTPKGDAAQFYSSYNTSGSSVPGGTVAMSASGVGGGGNSTGSGGVTMTGGNGNYYFTGLKVDSKGDVNIFGIGFVKAEGRTLEDITREIPQKVNEIF